MLKEYKNDILEFNRLKSLSKLLGGIATHKNSDISEYINPQINILSTAIILNNYDISSVLAKEILTEYKYEAYELNFAFYSLGAIPKEYINFKLLNERKYDVISNIRQYLNASSPLKIENFFTSAQIYLLSLYKKNNFTDTLMQNKTKLSQAKVIKSINTIMEHYLDMPSSNVYNKCFTKIAQVKTYFFDTPIYEYRTKDNVKLHPVFENEQEFKTISRIIL